MNNADNFPVDIDEQRAWACEEKGARGYSWPEFARRIGIANSTLSLFCTGSYAGNQENVARAIYRYRQLVESQQERSIGIPSEPGFFETPTAKRLNALLVVAHMGRVTVGATGPGTGKTMTIGEYRASVSNCWVATMRPTTKTVNAMIGRVLKAIGGSTKMGWTRQLSEQVVDMVSGRRGLIVIDEANNLELEAIEEIRAWHDETGVGICLMGNEELIQRIEGGPRRDAYARLNSRIAQRHVQTLPQVGDIAAFCDAWNIADAASRKFLERIAMTPGAGGLREMRQIVESACMLAEDEQQALSLGHLKDAQSTRATRFIRTGTNG